MTGKVSITDGVLPPTGLTAELPGRLRIPKVRALPLARLDALLSTAWEHRLTLVVAPAGSGKSTLLARFAAERRRPGRMVSSRRLGSRARCGCFGTWSRRCAVRARIRGDRLGDRRGRSRRTRVTACPNGASWWSTTSTRSNRPTPNGPSSGSSSWHRRPLTIVAARPRVARHEPAPIQGRRRAARDRGRRPSVPVVGGGAALSRLLRPVAASRGARRAHPSDGGLGGRPPAVPPRDPGQAAPPSGAGCSTASPDRPLASRATTCPATSSLTCPAELRRFLVGTAVLGRLTGPLCDRLLGRDDSAAVLRELEARCLFTLPLADPGAYRYHEVFRLHLLGALVDAVGETGGRAPTPTRGRAAGGGRRAARGARCPVPGGGVGCRRRPAGPRWLRARGWRGRMDAGGATDDAPQ